MFQPERKSLKISLLKIEKYSLCFFVILMKKADFLSVPKEELFLYLFVLQFYRLINITHAKNHLFSPKIRVLFQLSHIS